MKKISDDPILTVNIIVEDEYSDLLLKNISKQVSEINQTIQINILSNNLNIKKEIIEKSEININTTLIKPKASLASLKNESIKISEGLWLTFIKSNDKISENYIQNAINYIQQDRNIFGFKYLIKEHDGYSENKSISYKYKNEINEFDSESNKCIELTADNFFIKKDLIINGEILFPIDISEKLSDLMFINECIIVNTQKKYSNINTATYYSNKNNNYILSPKKDLNLNLNNDLVYGLLKLMNKYGRYNSVKNSTLFYMMHIYNYITSKDNELSNKEKERAKSNLTRLISMFNIDDIVKFNFGGCWFYQKVGWLNLFKGEHPDFQIYYISQSDKYIYITYYSSLNYDITINKGIAHSTEYNIVKHLNSIFLYENKAKINKESIKDIDNLQILDSFNKNIKISHNGVQYTEFKLNLLQTDDTKIEKKYKYYVGMGFNCELSFALQELNIFYSSIFSWADIRGTVALIKALNNPNLILSNKTKPYGKNMFFCETTNIGFHGKTKFEEMKGVNSEIDKNKLENSLNELKSRLHHLHEKMKTAIYSNKSLIILKHFSDIFEERFTPRQSAILINQTLAHLFPENKFDLLIIAKNCHDEEISNNIYIRSIKEFSHRNTANEANFDEWNRVISEFL